eukprot:349737-Pleurochrysis_carterae.AAC.3
MVYSDLNSCPMKHQNRHRAPSKKAQKPMRPCQQPMRPSAQSRTVPKLDLKEAPPLPKLFALGSSKFRQLCSTPFARDGWQKSSPPTLPSLGNASRPHISHVLGYSSLPFARVIAMYN